MNKVSKLEQETVINYNNEEKEADIFTYDKRLITKLRKRGVELIDVNSDGSYSCKVPKRWIKVTPTKIVSEENRIKMGERAKRMANEKAKQSSSEFISTL